MRSEIRDIFMNNSVESEIIREKARRLGAEYVGGNWETIQDFRRVNVRKITGGQSNWLYLISSESAQSYLLRIHRQSAEQVFVDTVIFSVLSVGPKFYGFFPGGRLEEYLPSRTLDNNMVCLPEFAAKIGNVYPKYHSINVPISKNRKAIQVMKEWLNDYKEFGGESHKIVPYNVKYPDETLPTSITVDQLFEELEIFEKWATIFNDTIVFSHNDLAPLNILELEKTKEIVFIDFEYATYNWRGFDLAMFLSENAFDYSDPTPPAIKIDQSFYEDHPTLKLFCQSYLDGLVKIKSCGRIPSLEDLIDECNFFFPLVNLFWAIWSLRSQEMGYDSGGIDLSVAASDRLHLYFHLKSQSEKIFNHRETINRIS